MVDIFVQKYRYLCNNKKKNICAKRKKKGKGIGVITTKIKREKIQYSRYDVKADTNWYA